MPINRKEINFTFKCNEFLKRIKISISHHTDTPDWKLIWYISYIYIFSPSCLRFHGWGIKSYVVYIRNENVFKKTLLMAKKCPMQNLS